MGDFMKKDLDQIISDFQKNQPTENQILQWSLAMERAQLRRRSWIHIAAGVAAGLLVGVLLSKNYFTDNSEPLEKFSATYEQVTVKNL